MVNVIDKTCIHTNCKTQPSFNIENEKTPLYCFEHKLENMVNIVNKTCLHPNCKTQPTFNIENEKTPLYCCKHKLENMVDVINKTCIHPNCKTQPTFNVENEKKGLYCFQHKLENMVDVINKTCIHPNCKTRPIYNVENEKTPLYCFEHKLENMVDISHKKCKTPLCDTRIANYCDDYCSRCFYHTFPEHSKSKNYKTKECEVTKFVKNTFTTIHWIEDQRIEDGKSLRRPDLFIRLEHQNIIVEVDENQHTDYECICENKRIMELSQDVKHTPIVFIRFNPDDYINRNNQKIKSCWSREKETGKLKISKQKEWEQRLQTLKMQIEYWMQPEHQTNKTIETIHLFYDEN